MSSHPRDCVGSDCCSCSILKRHQRWPQQTSSLLAFAIHAQGFLGYQDGVVSNLWTAKSYCSSSFAHVHGHKMEVNLPCWSCWDRTKKNFFRLAIMGYNGIYWDMGYNGTSTIIFYPCLSHYIPVKNVLCLLVEFLQNRLRGHAYARRTARSSAADARFCRRNKMGISPKVER